MNKLLLLAALAAVALTAKTPRDWKTGTLIDSAEETRTTGGSGPVAIARSNSGQNSNPSIAAAGDYAMAASIAASGPRTYTWQGFVIQGGGYVYMVKHVMNPRHAPNVTIRGPIKFTMEKDKFYILDEDGREFQMVS